MPITTLLKSQDAFHPNKTDRKLVVCPEEQNNGSNPNGQDFLALHPVIGLVGNWRNAPSKSPSLGSAFRPKAETVCAPVNPGLQCGHQPSLRLLHGLKISLIPIHGTEAELCNQPRSPDFGIMSVRNLSLFAPEKISASFTRF